MKCLCVSSFRNVEVEGKLAECLDIGGLIVLIMRRVDSCDNGGFDGFENASEKKRVCPQSVPLLTPHNHLAGKHFPLNAIYRVFFLLMEFMEYNRWPEPPWPRAFLT